MSDRISPLIKFTPAMLKQARHHWSRFIAAHERDDDRYFRTYPSGFREELVSREEGVETFRIALRHLENSLTRHGKAAKIRLDRIPAEEIRQVVFAIGCIFRHGRSGDAFRERSTRAQAWLDRHPLLRLAEEVEVE